MSNLFLLSEHQMARSEPHFLLSSLQLSDNDGRPIDDTSMHAWTLSRLSENSSSERRQAALPRLSDTSK
ncbi:hypothetical protein G6L46_03505 [Agrobacterium rhizogenes]|uniref:hypothetical protein n=1 Tax=Rhizobium rhizogenes TaxID=359 RepID=UPI001572853B|nr:hypothetical protein [Rhizobium rhizogenes]NTF86188.1 hypothetical protein [Rhizobium rhizogenes]